MSVYDLLSIDIRPTANTTQFCFKPDYSIEAYTYLAVQWNDKFIFLDKNKTLNDWLPGTEPPIFAEKASSKNSPPICFDPLSNAGLRDISVYAGVGQNLEDVIQTQNYAKIFNGFVELPQPLRNWTVMVYMIGADLESGKLEITEAGQKNGNWGSQDLLEMLAGTTGQENVNVVVTTGGSSSRYGWNTVKRAFIYNGQQYVLEDLGETGMTEPQTLTNFVLWANQNFPAQHRALILWDHGFGAEGYGLDQSPAGNNKKLSLPELQDAYQTIRQQLGQPLDVIVYDACLMATIEVAEVTDTLTSVMTASVDNEPPHGTDYTYLLSNLETVTDGMSFGKLVKAGYFKQAHQRGTFDTDRVTYSVLDLTYLKSVSDNIGQFAQQFKTLLEERAFDGYQTLSRGLIRAPVYPSKYRGGGRFSRFNADNKPNPASKFFPIDLYLILQTVDPSKPELRATADRLIELLNQLVKEYDTNDQMKTLHPQVGRLSIDVGNNRSYLAGDTLPEGYTLLKDALDLYSQKRQADLSTPEGKKVVPDCPTGTGYGCGAFANWLQLTAREVFGVEAYLGQNTGDVSDLYWIETIYQYAGKLTDKQELGIDGNQACQQQLCVNDRTCENLTVMVQGNQLLADIFLNGTPAILSFCQTPEGIWSACRVVREIEEGLFGPDDILYSTDQVTPTTVHLQNGTLETRTGQPLTVEKSSSVTLRKTCDTATAMIIAAPYGASGERNLVNLCQAAECVCEEKDFEEGDGKGDDSCKKLQRKAGVYITP